MFEFVPFLKGLYLTYGEYFAFVVCVISLFVALVAYIISRILFKCSKKPKKIKVGLIETIQVQSYRDVIRVLSSIVLAFTCFALVVGFTSLSAFRIVSIYTSIILNFITLVFLISSSQVTLGIQTTKTMAIRTLKWKWYLILLLLSLIPPLVFHGTCVCFYEDYGQYLLPFKAIGLSMNTQLSRYLSVPKYCHNLNAPCHIYATLPQDSSTQVFINFHTHTRYSQPLSLQYSIGDSKSTIESKVYIFDDLEARGQRNLHTFHLKNLIPGTLYKLALTINGVKHFYNYRTLKLQYTDQQPLKLISGGDVGNSLAGKAIWNQLQYQDPDVILIGGDLAYDNNLIDCYWTWDLFLQEIDQLANKLDRLVPVILALGNHDIGLNPYSKRTISYGTGAHPMFFSYFSQTVGVNGNIPQVVERPSYFVTHLGNVVLFTLDSGYLVSYADQAAYIDDYIAKHPQNKIYIAQYHHPTYSSTIIHDYEAINFQEGTLYWSSRFDKYSFATIYENHQHVHKRTKLLKGSLEDPSGTLYLGDGAWGADVASLKLVNHDYIAKILRVNSVWVSHIGDKTIKHSGLTGDGTIVDKVEQIL